MPCLGLGLILEMPLPSHQALSISRASKPLVLDIVVLDVLAEHSGKLKSWDFVKLMQTPC
ncbi:MAG TPA: hypothetical protein VIK55_05365 [Paludibacter sp.]